MPDLLIELLSEEIPARMQPRARADLRRLVTDGLVEAGLAYAGAEAFSTPRRLALTVHGLPAASRATVEERRGPRLGAPEKAVEGFARGAGVAVADLYEKREGKGAFLFARIETPGRPAEAIVAEVLEAAIRGFPWPKSMRWGAGSLRWVRPLRRILCILSDEAGARTVPLSIDRIEAGDVTEGHRFMAPGPLRVTSFEDYAGKLARAHVILSAEERAGIIRAEAQNLAFAAGLEVVEDAGLLDEVAGLTEWPVTLMGAIEERFLDLPPEVLRTSMKEHQKFFSVRDEAGRITRFVTVANRETADDGATILAGNARVLAARLADAAFFWERDLAVAKRRHGGMAPEAGERHLPCQAGQPGGPNRPHRRARARDRPERRRGPRPSRAMPRSLAKLDLASEMVGEFPELPGHHGPLLRRRRR